MPRLPRVMWPTTGHPRFLHRQQRNRRLSGKFYLRKNNFSSRGSCCTQRTRRTIKSISSKPRRTRPAHLHGTTSQVLTLRSNRLAASAGLLTILRRVSRKVRKRGKIFPSLVIMSASYSPVPRATRRSKTSLRRTYRLQTIPQGSAL